MLHIFRKICRFFILPFVLPAVAEAYTITYNLMGGVNHPDNPTSYESVGTERLPWLPPTREGYSFLGLLDIDCRGTVRHQECRFARLWLFYQ